MEIDVCYKDTREITRAEQTNVATICIQQRLQRACEARGTDQCGSRQPAK